MTTHYYSGFAITSFSSSTDLYAFIAKPGGLKLIEIDYFRRFIKWSF